MDCECITRVNKQLKEFTGDPDASLELMMPFIEGKLIAVIPVLARYREKKDDGSLKVRPSKKFMMAAYCPFCGKKQVPEKLTENKLK